MKLTEKIPWLMGRLQRTLFPCLEECCATPLTKQEQHLVKVLEIIEIENHVFKNRQWTGRPPAERKAIARSYVAIIDRNVRKGEAIPMRPHEARRYNERSSCERFNGRLKEEFGGRHVMVRDPDKVMMHLMFGVVALFADQLMKLTGY